MDIDTNTGKGVWDYGDAPSDPLLLAVGFGLHLPDMTTRPSWGPKASYPQHLDYGITVTVHCFCVAKRTLYRG